MSRTQQIKELYPLACAGDAQAIKELSQLTDRRYKDKYSSCEVCGVTITRRLSHNKRSVARWCRLHMPHRKSAIFFRKRITHERTR